MRLLALVLLVINGLIFSWIEWGQSGPQPIPAQIHPDKVSLVRQTGFTPAGATIPGGPKSAAGPASTPGTVASPSPGKSPVVMPESPIPAAAPAQRSHGLSVQSSGTCVTWGPIPAKRADDAQLRLLKLKLGHRLSYTDDTTTRSGPYWVYFPPLPTKLAADDKLAELLALGLKDIAVVRSGTWKNAISMGLYSREPIADARVADAAKKGVTAKIEARGLAERIYTLNHLTPDEHAALQKLQADFGGPALKTVTCPIP